MLFKAMGALLVIISTTFFGVKCADDMKEEYRQMRYLQRMIAMMESEIRYARTHLGEIFFHIAGQAKEPYKAWLLFMRREMSLGGGKAFEEIWSQSIKGYLPEAGLPKRELERLAGLGSQLGTADIVHQLGVLELYQQQLSVSMEELYAELGTKVKLCQCLGVMSGILIAILLV